MAGRELFTQPSDSLRGAGDGRTGRTIERNADPNDARKRRRSFLGTRLRKLVCILLRRSRSSPPTGVRSPGSTPSTVQGQKPDEVPFVPGFKFSVTNDDESKPAQPTNSPPDPIGTSGVTGSTTSEVSSVSSHQVPATDANKGAPANPSSSSVEPTTAYENRQNLKETVQATTRLVIDLARDGADVFVPLKSAAGTLSTILKYYDQTIKNRKTIESLIPRVEDLAKSLGRDAPEGETKEIGRRKALEKKLEEVRQGMKPLEERGKITGFLNNAKDAEILTDLAEDIREAMMDYQTALQQDIFDKNSQLINKADLFVLKNMYHATNAGFRAGDRSGCLRGTRKDVLSQIEKWSMNEGGRRIFWLNGLAGTGKTTIAQTFAETSFAEGKLGASFFCSRDFEDRRNLHTIFPTLAFQLAHRYPLFRDQLLQVLEANADIERDSLCSQLENLIVRPLKEARTPTLIIIDALDECKDKEPASALLYVLSRYVHEIPEVKFFITGRPEAPIEEGFRLRSLQPITNVFRLHEVERSSVDEDIKLYLRVQLKDIRETRRDSKFPGEWPSSFDINVLCKKAGGLFIYASTVAKFVGSPLYAPTERLDQIIERSPDARHEGGIDRLYTQILELAYGSADSGEEELYFRFRAVVGAVLLIFHPLSTKALSDLVKKYVAPSRISTTLKPLRSLLHVPDDEDQDDTIRVFHKSFPDFLTDPNRCQDKRFFVDLSLYHENILLSCVDLMKGLKKNICDLDDHAVLDEVQDLSARKEVYIGGSLEYACGFWTKHLATIASKGPHVEQMREAIDEFFKTRLLRWVEVLSIMGHLGVAVYAIDEIRQWCTSAGIPTSKHADDSERLILEHFDMIRNSPSHIYHSALPLSPSSWLHECYEPEVTREVRVLVGLPEKWDTCSRTIPIEGRPTAFAHWGDTISVALEPDNVVFLDAITGNRKFALSGHTGIPLSLAFSPDGTLFVSGSRNATVQLWDMQTGGLIWTLSGHTSAISSVSISADNATIASGSMDGSIYLWSIRTGRRLPAAILHDYPVTAINFSPADRRLLISSSDDGTVQQWDVDGRQIGKPCDEEVEIAHVTYAPDGTRFVSCGGSVAVIRDSKSGAVVVKIDGSKQMLNFQYCCFSPDGKFLACAAGHNVCVWDVTNLEPRLVGNLVGHSENIIFIVFSSSLISGSWDQSVKFWQSTSFSSEPTSVDGTPARLIASAPIESVNVFAEDHTAVTTNSSGVVETWDLATGKRKSSFSTPIEGIRDTYFGGDRLIAVWQGQVDGKRVYHVWDASGGQIRTVESAFEGELLDLRISGDGSMVFGLDEWRIEARVIQTGEVVDGTPVWHEKKARKGSLVVRGCKVWVAGSGGGGWDFEGSEVRDFPLSKGSPLRLRLHFVDRPPHSTQPAWIQDVITERVVFRLPDRYLKPDVKRRWDGRYLVICSPSGEVVIMDFENVCSD